MESLRVISERPKNNWYRAPHILDKEDIDLEERWVLQCLMRGVTGTGVLSTISIKKICSWRSYTDENGNYHPYGKDWVNAKIKHLADVGKIIINKGARGKCTTYTINGLDKFEQVPDALYYVPMSPAQKGYIVFMLQHNVNNFRKRKNMKYDPDVAECDYQEIDLQNTTHLTMPEIRKIENSLAPYGFFEVINTTKKHKAENGGIYVTSRRMNLPKLNAFLIATTNTGRQIDDVYDTIAEIQSDINEQLSNVVTKDVLKNVVSEALQELILKNGFKMN